MPVAATSDPGPLIQGASIADSALPQGKERRIFDLGPFLSQRVLKRSEDTLDWFLDLFDWLEPTEIVTACTAQVMNGDVVIQRAEFGTTGVVVWLTGGSDGVRHMIHVLVTTSRNAVKLIRFSVLTRGTVVITEFLPVISMDRAAVLGPGDVVDPEAQPGISFSATTLSFGTIAEDETGDLVLTITNTGTAPLVITSATATGDFSVIEVI